MSDSKSPIKEMFPYLRLSDAQAGIAFYSKAFGAVEDFRLTEPAGRVGHAELKLGGGILMIADAYPEYGLPALEEGVNPGQSIHLHVDDADAFAERAVAAGATMIREAEDHFYGERSCKLLDPFGFEWLIGHTIEEVTPAEMQRRFTAMFEG